MKSVIGASALTLLVVGVVIFAFFSSPFERSHDNVNEVLVIEGGELMAREFTVNPNYDQAASFTVSNGTIITCDPLNDTFYHYWRENEHSPSWYAASEREYKHNAERGILQEYIITWHVYVFLFDNQDSYEKQVHIQVTLYYFEQNTTNLTVASALTLSGLVLGIGLTAKAHKDKASTNKTRLPIAAGILIIIAACIALFCGSLLLPYGLMEVAFPSSMPRDIFALPIGVCNILAFGFGLTGGIRCMKRKRFTFAKLSSEFLITTVVMSVFLSSVSYSGMFIGVVVFESPVLILGILSTFFLSISEDEFS